VTLRFMLDEDISDRVAVGLRARGVDAVSVHEIGRDNQRLPDDVQLAYAVGQGRVLVTYNRGDFQLLDVRWREEGRLHAGIFWCLEQTIARTDIGGADPRTPGSIGRVRHACRAVPDPSA
jgi:hypothetical protein